MKSDLQNIIENARADNIIADAIKVVTNRFKEGEGFEELLDFTENFGLNIFLLNTFIYFREKVK